MNFPEWQTSVKLRRRSAATRGVGETASSTRKSDSQVSDFMAEVSRGYN